MPGRSAGRVRDPELDVLIRATALQLLGEAGVDGCVLTEVARRAGVGKATIYRRWPTKEELIQHVLQGPPPRLVAPEETGPFRAEAQALLHTMVSELETMRASAWRRVVPALPPEVRLSMGVPASPVGDVPAAIEIILVRARRRGDIAAGQLAVLEMALHAAYATLLERWLTQVDKPSVPLALQVDRLLVALVDPHLEAAAQKPSNQPRDR